MATAPGKHSDRWWVEECQYIERVTAVGGNVAEMNNDREVFMRYCQMQCAQAWREGRHDSATYIEHCIDDLKDMK